MPGTALSNTAATPNLMTGHEADVKNTIAPGDIIGSSVEDTSIFFERLARQLEYYFSTANLENDTYVSTLRSLNDGYVPLSIISNFGKVKQLTGNDSLNAVRKAALEFSELLEVVVIDTFSGKRVAREAVVSSMKTVEAVGPKSGEPIPMSSILPSPSLPEVLPRSVPSIPVQNTIIIREAPAGTKESDILGLFAFEGCPPIDSMHLDIANCWFVTLSTTLKDDMINTMLALRSQKFPSGESVKARLKSVVAQNADVSPASFRVLNADAPTVYAPSLPNISKKGGTKKKKSPGGGRTKNKSGAQSKASKGGKQSTDGSSQRQKVDGGHNSKKKSGSPKQVSESTVPKASEQAAPSLGEDQFPALPSDDLMSKNKVEVSKLPEQRLEDDAMKAQTGSDSASTATTTSSSSSSKNNGGPSLMGGYAAALLKTAPTPVRSEMVKEAERSIKNAHNSGNIVNRKQRSKGISSESEVKSRQKASKKIGTEDNSYVETPVVNAQAPSWGSGRTFADVLRKEAAALAAPSQQSMA